MAAEKLVLDFEKSLELAYLADRRISEKEKLVGVARGLLQEANGAESWIYDVNTFLALSPQIKSGNVVNADKTVNSDALDFDGVSPWFNLEFTIVRPLTTFGKIEHKVVSELSVESRFKKAYLLLNVNRKRGAVKALNLYNLVIADYKGKEDDLSLMILKHLDHGITVSSSIANHEYPDRYQ